MKTVKDLKWINNGKHNKRVTKNQLDSYLESGWSLGQLPTTSNHIWLHKDGKNTSIDKSKLDEYLADGYEIGKLVAKNKYLRVNKDGVTKSIKVEELARYESLGWTSGVAYTKSCRWINNLQQERWTDDELSDGWYLGRLTKDPYKKVYMYNDTEVIEIEKYLICTYKEKGYLVGKGKKNGLYAGSTKDTIWMNNDIDTILVSKNELTAYLDKGYVRGSLKLQNRVSIHNDTKSKKVKLSDLDSYLSNGFSLGTGKTNHMINKKWLQKEDLFKAVPIEEVQTYLDDGWYYGRPIRASLNKIWINKDGIELTYIDLDELPKYLELGWHSGKVKDSKPFYVNNGKEDKLVTLDEFNLNYRKSGWMFGTKHHGPTSTIEYQFIDLLEENEIKYQLHFYLNYNGKRYFYDFKIDDVLIELNPSATHNSTWSPYGNPKEYDYHYLKSKAARDSGYRCICIWDWDSVDILLALLKNRQTIYARNCEIREVDISIAKEYLINNHFQGYAKDSIRLGLYYHNELVSIMTFGKPRYSKKYKYEIIRYCSTYNVTGGAEKLFKHFLNSYNPQSIVSYCDLGKFNGDVYSKLGFKYSHYSIGKHWYNISTTKHITDNLLRQQGFDRLLGKEYCTYGKGSDNIELVLQHGFVELYDCGQAVYIWE